MEIHCQSILWQTKAYVPPALPTKNRTNGANRTRPRRFSKIWERTGDAHGEHVLPFYERAIQRLPWLLVHSASPLRGPRFAAAERCYRVILSRPWLTTENGHG
jgi:hypothetical protein